MNVNKTVYGYMQLLLVILIWGGNYHVAKFLVGELNIFMLTFVRFLISVVVLFIFNRRKYRVKIKYTWRHWGILFLLGLIGVFGYNIVFFAAETLISANNVAILFAFTPCISLILSRIFLKQYIPFLAYVGVIIAFIGTLAVISANETQCHGEFLCFSIIQNLSLGQIYAALAALCMGAYSMLNKQAAYLGIDSLIITTFGSLVAAVGALICTLFLKVHWIALLDQSYSFWLAMLYMSVLATVLGYRWYSDAIHFLGVGQTTIFLNALPFMTILIGVIFLNQTINMRTVIAGIIIIVGVLLTNYVSNTKIKIK